MLWKQSIPGKKILLFCIFPLPRLPLTSEFSVVILLLLVLIPLASAVYLRDQRATFEAGLPSP
jgi:hypothetical protein